MIVASASEHADLFRALKGGSSNFGVVVAFHLYTYPQGPVYAGSYFMNHAHHDEFIDLIVPYTAHDADITPNTHVLPAFFKNAAGGPLGTSYASFYLLHNDGPSFYSETPDIFKPFLQIPFIENSLAVKNLTDVFGELESETGHRYVFSTSFPPSSRA